MGTKFNEKIRQRIFDSTITYSSSSSSGSDHDGESDVVSPSSFCLSHLVQNFLEDDDPDSVTTREFASDFDSESSLLGSDPTAMIVSFINPIVRNNADPFRNKLLVTVSKAVEIFAVFRQNRSVFSQNLVRYLREKGYDAGICKTRWKSSSGGMTAGKYEFIDVLREDSSPESVTVRYVIDVEFTGEFEIARETERYSILRSSLPRVFVGKCDELKKIVRFMCDESKRSMTINGLTLPPWRKNRYILAKWLGPYRRTTNQSSATATGVLSSAVTGYSVKCRSVGFDLTGDGCQLVVLPAN